MLSFGFTKKADAKKLHSSTIYDNEVCCKNATDTDFLESFENNEIKSVKPVTEKTPLVIPLIQNNHWRHAKKPEELETDLTPLSNDNSVCNSNPVEIIGYTGDEVTDEAIMEILADAASVAKGSCSVVSDNLAIPLLLKNKVPIGYETDDHLDVALRPDEGTEEDYEKIPVEQFGLAMLRGMGWKDGQGIGKDYKIVKPLEPILRPKGLGLGADKSVKLQVSNRVRPFLSDTDDNGEELIMKKGAYCIFVSGKYNSHYGTIAGIDEDSTRVVVTLAIGGEMVKVTQFVIKLVTKKEFDKCSKYISQRKFDRYNEKMGSDRDRRGCFRDIPSSKRAGGSGDRDRQDVDCLRSEGSNKPVSMRSRQSDEPLHKRKHTDNNTSAADIWLRPNLRVRIIDKFYKNGKYYKMKVAVIDVIGADLCVCQTDHGQVLDDMNQSQLETVIPHQIPSYVMIVSGKYHSQLAQLLERNKDSCCAVVQLLSDRNIALTLDFDAICEYAADVAVDDFDY